MASIQTPSRKKAQDAKLNELTTGPEKDDYGLDGEVVRVRKTLTGVVEILDPTSGKPMQLGGTPLQRFNQLLSGGQIKFHVYGNSMLAAQNSHFNTAISASGCRMQVVQNSAVTSYTTANVIAKMATDGINPLCDAVIIQEGTNDASAALSNLAHIANIQMLVNTVIAAGKIPVLFLTPPTDSASYIDKMNQYAIRQYLLARSLDVPVFDPFLRYRDTDGSLVAGVSTDTIHPINSGYSQAGNDLWANIAAHKPTRWTPNKNAGFGILNTSNVLHLTDSNADGFPDGWSQAGMTATTYTLTDYAYPFVGKKCNAAVNQSALGAVYKNVTTGFAAGNSMKLIGVLGMSSATNMLGYCTIVCKNSGGTVLLKNTVWSSAQDIADTAFEHDFTVPTDTTLIELYINAYTATTGAFSGTLSFGGFELLNATTLLST